MSKIFKNVSVIEGYRKIASKDNSDLSYIEMGRLFLKEVNSIYENQSGDREIGFNILSGVINLRICVNDSEKYEFNDIGERMNPFSGLPTMIYIPINSKFHIEVKKPPFNAEVYWASSSLNSVPEVIYPDQICSVKTGELNWTRIVRVGISNNVKAQRLILGETLTPSGNWSSYPPHKHDERRLPFEKPAEEVYSFYFDRPEGFAFIRLYTPDNAQDSFDEAYVVKNGDVITIRRGYHPIAVAPGYQCCYLFCLAGDERSYGAWSDDPDFSWIRGCETIICGNKMNES